jgi:3-methyladenine DNA glycosylase AlkD
MTALIILVIKIKRKQVDETIRKKIYNLYLKNYKYVNNWDLVDLSAPNIVGGYLFDKPKERKKLYTLANSSNLWKKRIAIISTVFFIKNNDFEDTIKISKILLNDKHDLIHKAVGWMLREVGKRNVKILENFLKKHYKKMPRTMLRYAIEKLPEKRRKMYLKNEV